MKKVLKWLDQYFELVIMGIALTTIIVSVTLDIVLRNLTGSGLAFAQELSQKCEIVLAAMGISYGVVTGKHMKVDILQTFFPKTKKPLEVVGDIVIFLFCGFMAVFAINKLEGTLASGATTAILEIPTFYIYLTMEIGLILACIRIVEKYIKNFLFREGEIQ
ncbi:TRAP transporter small permease [Kallipyga massiliensis]|uniref:TRAP transporter small permease n=1 Tax=Kallipyga massiliensis TaxID=1472764 RepID=UPI000566843D|nr:TRAP transporter small permease [Kallipyga massiliensis]